MRHAPGSRPGNIDPREAPGVRRQACSEKPTCTKLVVSGRGSMMTICGIIFRVCVRDPKGRTRSLMAPVFTQARTLVCARGRNLQSWAHRSATASPRRPCPYLWCPRPRLLGAAGGAGPSLGGSRHRLGAPFFPRSRTIPALGTDSHFSKPGPRLRGTPVARRRDNYLLNYPLSFSGNVCSSISREGGGGCLAKSVALDRTRCVKCSVLAGTPAHDHGRRQLTTLGTAGSPPSFP